MCLTGVKLRLERENPLTFLEFNYMILQAYDFLELNRRFKCTLQLGGSDQWGNMVCAPSLAHSFPIVLSMRTLAHCRPPVARAPLFARRQQQRSVCASTRYASASTRSPRVLVLCVCRG